jgi:hypothetical protein
MNPLDLTFLLTAFPRIRINGQIFESQNPIVLSEDLLEISLPSGKTIDVGWYPEHDPTGQYRVLLYRGHTGYALKRIDTRSLFEVLQTLQNWIAEDEFAGAAVASSGRTLCFVA